MAAAAADTGVLIPNTDPQHRVNTQEECGYCTEVLAVKIQRALGKIGGYLFSTTVDNENGYKTYDAICFDKDLYREQCVARQIDEQRQIAFAREALIADEVNVGDMPEEDLKVYARKYFRMRDDCLPVEESFKNLYERTNVKDVLWSLYQCGDSALHVIQHEDLRGEVYKAHFYALLIFAHERGEPKALFELGKALDEGEFTDPKEDLSRIYMQFAADRGNKAAREYLGEYYVREGNRFFDAFRQLVHAGIPSSDLLKKQAIDAYKKGARLGNKAAIRMLGGSAKLYEKYRDEILTQFHVDTGGSIVHDPRVTWFILEKLKELSII